MSAARRRWLARGALCLPLLGVGELAWHLQARRRAPAFEAYAALTGPVAELAGPEDRVVAAPPWITPLVQRAVPITIRDAAPPDDDAYDHVLEVSAMGESAPAYASWPVVAELAAPPFMLRRRRNPAPRPTRFDFVDALGPERAQVELAGQTCGWRRGLEPQAGNLGGHPTFAAERFVCPGSRFFNVSATVIADETFQPRRCLWAHPPASGALVLRYRDVPLADRIVGHAGMYWIVEREGKGAPIELEVSVDGQPLATVVHRDGDGWLRFEAPLAERAGGVGEVSFAVRSSDHHHRHFCFEARVQ